MQKELIEIRKRRPQAQMDRVLWQRRKRKSLNHKQLSLAPSYNFFPFINLRTLNTKVYPIRICVAPRKNGFINTRDIHEKGNKMSTKKKTQKPEKVDFLELSSSKKARLLKKVKENLQQKRMEAKFWRSLAQTERITINGQTIQF